MSIYAMGIPAGALFGALLGGWVAQSFGWRAAFMVVGLPGILLAGLMFTIREPDRGRFDPVPAAEGAPSLMTVLARLWRKKTFVHISAGAALATFANYGISSFAVPYLLRGFNVSLVQASTAYGLITGVAAVLGTAMGGWLVDRCGVRDRRWYTWIPAIGVTLSAPLYMLTLSQGNLLSLAAFVVLPAIIHYLYLGPTFGLTSNMVEARMRATASAILLLIMNLFGLGLGPTVVGALSDVFAAHSYLGDYLGSCPGGIAPKDAGAAAMAACKLASFTGVRYAMFVAAGFYVWAGLHYFLAARSVHADLEPH
jgi:predicted MFS family arabinose efflux permease